MGWWRITFEPQRPPIVADGLDALGFELMELGAASALIEDSGRISCYLEGDQARCDDFECRAREIGLCTIDRAAVADENWHERCPEVWQPLIAGDITIVPVQSEEDPRPVPPGALKLIPGQGFGTGHHPTTRMILEELSVLAARGVRPTGQVLDVGTGSGILALAAAQLFRTCVLALDIEDAALQNARDNVRLNGLGERIRLENVALHELAPSFGLVVANVYGEVLVQLSGEIERLSAPGCYTLLSGITELVRDQVIAAYPSSSWALESERTQDDWVCLVLRRLPLERDGQAMDRRGSL